MSDRVQTLRGKLEELRRRDKTCAVFGARAPQGHAYECRPALSERQLHELEESFGVELPGELRAFLRTVHSGGAGPGYGFFIEPDAERLPRRARPFPFDAATARDVISKRLAGGDTRWATVSGPRGTPDDDDDSGPPGPGFVPIAHHGCGVFDVIVVSGEQRGLIWWYDMSWGPCYDGEGRQLGFLDWYEAWLDEGLCDVDARRK